jgi:hypothetical protein
MPNEDIARAFAMMMVVEAVNSCALDRDGTTSYATNWKPERDDEGFGCPHCGTPLEPDKWEPGVGICKGLPCCGYYPEGKLMVRLLAARRLLQAA